MDVREKLVEIIQNSVGGCARHWAEVIADGLIANGVTVQEWISVKDRFPEEDEYIAKTKDGIKYYRRLLIAYQTDIVEYEIGYYDGYKWLTEMPMRRIKDVVAWMLFPNMPQPPKGE
jgi:hypothetical protein